MKSLRKKTGILVGTALGLLSSVTPVIHGQTPPDFAPEMNGTNVDELPDDPQQMRTWRCTQEDKAIVVEAKDVPIWKEMVEGERWQCMEELSVIPPNDRKISCEPSEIIGILTIFWLEGKGGKQQMQEWMDRLTEEQGMVCTLEKTTLDWD